MKTENLQRLLTHGVALDTETHLMQPGIKAPPLVCAGVAKGSTGELLTPERTLEVMIEILTHGIYINANTAFDLLVIAVYAATKGVDLIPLIFQAFEDDRVFDILIAEQLHAMAEGTTGRDPRTGSPLKSPSTGKQCGYNQEVVVDIVLGRTSAKVNDRFRMSYALLEHIPMSEWPEDARIYPIDDAVNAYEVAIVQATRNRNLHDLARQTYTAWTLQLGAAWGYNVDPVAIAGLKEKTAAAKLAGQAQFLDAGILKTVKEKGVIVVKKDTATFKKAIADAYGCTGVCATCKGLRKVPGSSKCLKSCPGADCTRCLGFGFKVKNCKACDCTGYDLDSVAMPRTETGLIGGGRDALYESGDELLTEFAAWTEADKIGSTYIPWLERGIKE